MAITAFLYRSPGLLNRGPGAHPLWDMVLIPASSLQLIWTSTAQSGVLRTPSAGRRFSLPHLISSWLTFCLHPGYIIVRRPPSCGRHKSRLFNPSTVKVISWYSSTGCTCYLHRCISNFDGLTGVNMLHKLYIWLNKLLKWYFYFYLLFCFLIYYMFLMRC